MGRKRKPKRFRMQRDYTDAIQDAELDLRGIDARLLKARKPDFVLRYCDTLERRGLELIAKAERGRENLKKDIQQQANLMRRQKELELLVEFLRSLGRRKIEVDISELRRQIRKLVAEHKL